MERVFYFVLSLSKFCDLFSFFNFIYFKRLYLFMRERERMSTGEGQRQRENGAPH